MYNGVYPAYIKPYTGIKPKTVQQKGDEEKSSGSSSREEQPAKQTQIRANNFQLSGYRNIQSSQVQPAAKQSINISQIVTDFKNTTGAVGASKEVTEEVFAYLNLIETQAQKDVPNKKIIQSNLKNASQVLDTYITGALKTQSQVVENWIDALFLQKIDYKADADAVNNDFKLNLPERERGTASAVEAEPIESSVAETQKHYIPGDEKMRTLFKSAKAAATADAKNDPKTALIALKRALDYAVETDDKKMQSMIYYETADFYNKRGQYPQALKGYKIAAELASDENLIAKSYLKTGKIYSEASLFKPAVNHYFSAVSYAGESENLPMQVKALGNIAELYGETYEKNIAYQFISLANETAEATQNDKITAYAYKKSAEVSEYLEDKPKALQYLKQSTQSYSNANDSENMISNYIAAAEIMAGAGNEAKARNLLNKAYLIAVKTDLTSYIPEITGKIAEIAA